ncbi:uncharacterized protein LOC126318346 [Schistocerca gregaria]|uniref:uncharacterized protein LOC126318346 n=1 Tax=Schistocerca gregaria TaxID=7010 RepID=UPI00211DF3FF|nr:uncharacterized protein LOC126318346 [Schistocerca gregaria]
MKEVKTNNHSLGKIHNSEFESSIKAAPAKLSRITKKTRRSQSAVNVCCHHCRTSKSQRSARASTYISCSTCSHVYCRHCLEVHLKVSLASISLNTFSCNWCQNKCCCQIPDGCYEPHQHCFTYRRTCKRHASKAYNGAHKYQHIPVECLQIRALELESFTESLKSSVFLPPDFGKIWKSQCESASAKRQYQLEENRFGCSGGAEIGSKEKCKGDILVSEKVSGKMGLDLSLVKTDQNDKREIGQHTNNNGADHCGSDRFNTSISHDSKFSAKSSCDSEGSQECASFTFPNRLIEVIERNVESGMYCGNGLPDAPSILSDCISSMFSTSSAQSVV